MGLYGNCELKLEEKSQAYIENDELSSRQSLAFGELDYINNQRNALDLAEYYFQRGVEAAQQIGSDQYFDILNRSFLALVYSKKGRWVEALTIGKKALQDALSQGGMIARICQTILSAIFMEIGDYKEAKELGISAALLKERNPHTSLVEKNSDIALRGITSIKREKFGLKQEAVDQEETGSYLFKIKMFGPMRVFHREQELDATSWRTVKTRDLLAYLAHQDKPVSTDQILEDLWPNSELDKAFALVHTTLYYLRRLLQRFTDKEIIIHGSKRYQLRPGSVLTDQSQFKEIAHLALEKTMTQALANELESTLLLYRGDYLEDLDYQWVIPAQEELRNLNTELKQKLAVYYLRNKMYSRAMTHLHQLIALKPYSEEVLRLLLIASAGMGDQSAVKKQYMAFSQTISEELRLQPSPEITAFYKKLCDINRS